MKTALFLGAGASKFLGMPTTVELMSGVHAHINKKEHGRDLSKPTKDILIQKGGYRDVEQLYDGIDRVLGLRDNTPNIWPIWDVLHGDNETSKRVFDDLRLVRSIIRDVLLTSFRIKLDAYDHIVQMYDMVWSVMKNNGTGVFQVFTTNYDTVLEKYCDLRGLDIVNGFRREGRAVFGWAGEWPTSTPNSTHLTKLHGSINWYKDVDDRIVETGDVTQRDADKDVMIAPTEGEKDYGDMPFESLMAHFKKEIRLVDVLLVIGFSYRDDNIVDVIKDRLKEGMVLISVSPTAVADARRAFTSKIGTVGVGGMAFKTAGKRVVLVEQKFTPGNIDEVRSSLEAVYKLTQEGTVPAAEPPDA